MMVGFRSFLYHQFLRCSSYKMLDIFIAYCINVEVENVDK